MVVSNMGIFIQLIKVIYSKLYGFAAANTIQYCKSILATLIRDAISDQDGSIRFVEYIRNNNVVKQESKLCEILSFVLKEWKYEFYLFLYIRLKKLMIKITLYQWSDNSIILSRKLDSPNFSNFLIEVN